MSTEIAKQTFLELATGKELPITTKYVIRTVNTPVQMRVPLYEHGVMISSQKLAQLGLQIKNYTKEEVQQQICEDLYRKDAQGDGALKRRVQQYKQILDQLGLPYNASQDVIMLAIQEAPVTDAQKAAYALTLKTVYDAVTTNLEYLGSHTPHKDTYQMMQGLILNLPSEE